MKDSPIYLLISIENNLKIQKELMDKGNVKRQLNENDKFIIIYSLDDFRKSTEIKIHSKTKLQDRPKSAGDVMKQPNSEDEVFIKKANSLSNIEDFFMKRRIPLIKPLISQREILKLQLLQEQCRRKRVSIAPVNRLLQKTYIENTDKGFYPEQEEEKSKFSGTKSSPLLDAKVQRDGPTKHGNKRQEEIKDSKTISPASVKSKQGVRKSIKDLTSNKSKRGLERKDRERIDSTLKSDKKFADNKPRTKRSETILTKNNSKTKDKTKTSKSKDRSADSDYSDNNQSKESKDKKSKKGIHNQDSNKDTLKGAGNKMSKQKIKSDPSVKDTLAKGASKYSKDEKSDKSDKSESGKSRKLSESSNRKGKNKNTKEQDSDEQVGKMKPQSEDSKTSRCDKNDGTSKSEVSKGGKSKPGAASETTSNLPLKEKPQNTYSADGKQQKSSLGRKSVKFPSLMQHIIHYVLSNPLFIKLGWTLEPSDQAQLQVVTFRANPATPNTYCFRERREDEIKYYSKSQEQLAFQFRTDGTGEIFYPSGVLAAVVTKHNTGMRLTLYSDPKKDPLISDSFHSKVLAIFDSFGNGVVYDMQGRKLLNYNQLEGIFCSPHRKSPYKWQWCDYKILDGQRLKALLRHMAKEQKQPVAAKKTTGQTIGSTKKAKSEEKKVEKDVDEAYEQILAELPYPAPQKTKTKSENQFWGFKPITLKINNEMTLRINGQDDMAVSFSANKIFLRIDLGVKIDPDVVEKIEELSPKRVSDVPCVFDALLNLSPSLLNLTSATVVSRTKVSS